MLVKFRKPEQLINGLTWNSNGSINTVPFCGIQISLTVILITSKSIYTHRCTRIITVILDQVHRNSDIEQHIFQESVV